MKKDIEFPKVEDVGMAIVPETTEKGEDQWYVYLINKKAKPLEMVIVNSTGYGDKKGKQVKTTTLRKMLGTVPPKTAQKVEPLMEDLFDIANEFWLSFWLNEKMYDRKYVFVEGSIRDRNMTSVPFLDKKGVMII